MHHRAGKRLDSLKEPAIGISHETPRFVKDAQFQGDRSCYVAAAINDRSRDPGPGSKGSTTPYSARLEGHEHPTSIWITMFRQAKISNHEYLSEGGRNSIVGNYRLTARPASLPDIRSVSMNVSTGDVYRCRDNLVTREIVGETIIVPITGELADLQQVYSLNATGAFVWQRLDGSASLEIIHQAVTKHFKVRKKDAWEDLVELVEDLARASLIEKVQ